MANGKDKIIEITGIISAVIGVIKIIISLFGNENITICKGKKHAVNDDSTPNQIPL